MARLEDWVASTLQRAYGQVGAVECRARLAGRSFLMQTTVQGARYEFRVAVHDELIHERHGLERHRWVLRITNIERCPAMPCGATSNRGCNMLACKLPLWDRPDSATQPLQVTVFPNLTHRIQPHSGW